jgi:hypothetical protein
MPSSLFRQTRVSKNSDIRESNGPDYDEDKDQLEEKKEEN